jgi:two-component system sensor histidine kinase/response regulator
VPKVLVVDDNKFSLGMMHTMIKGQGTEVEIATDGQEAVNIFKDFLKKRQHFDIIMMDLIMPTMDGFEATKEIRKIEAEKRLKKTYICAFSANVDAKVKDKCDACQFDNLVNKPLGVKDFRVILDTIK